MLDRLKFWWQVFARGAVNLNSAAGWFSLIVLLLGVAAGIGVPQVFHVSHWLTAVILMAIVIIVVLQGSYSVWAATDAERKTALQSAEEKPSAPVHSPTFWAVSGGNVSGDIKNTYNAASEGHDQGGRLIVVNPGSSIDGLVTVEYGDSQPPALPEPLPSTADERIGLRDQLLTLADEVETVMLTWGQTRQAIAKRVGIAPNEFMARMSEILSERSRVDAEATARYNAEYRSTVIQVYGHARSIRFGDVEMERLWRTQHGAGSSRIPVLLRNIAARISD